MSSHVDHDFDYLYLGDSDVDKAESSEDEIDILLHGTPEQRRRLRRDSQGSSSGAHRPRKRHQEPDSDSEDEFERALNAELNQKVSALESKRVRNRPAVGEGAATEDSGSTAPPPGKRAAETFYDDIYFDSDEEADSQDQKKRRKMMSNDDLLYDPDMDDEDERWVQDQLTSHQPRLAEAGLTARSAASKSRGKGPCPPCSDAKLDCPACLTTLCLDCQRHDLYKNQYRAVFVMNCQVDASKKLHYPMPERKKKKMKQRGKRQRSQQEAVEEEEGGEAIQGEATPATGCADNLYNPVKCQECSTVVAVYDTDEVYHFFNVLATYS